MLLSVVAVIVMFPLSLAASTASRGALGFLHQHHRLTPSIYTRSSPLFWYNSHHNHGGGMVQQPPHRGVRTRRHQGPLDKLMKLFSVVEEEVDPGEVEGTSLRILKYPDPRLRTKNEEITDFGPELQQTAKEMFKVMYAAKGVGLAAPQVGINKRLMVFNSGTVSTQLVGGRSGALV